MKLIENGGAIRKLWPGERHLIKDHLLRLDDQSRRARFGLAVSDNYICDYTRAGAAFDGVTHAFILGGAVRAAAELRRVGEPWRGTAEAAFSVERDWQDLGIGSELLGRIIRSARNRGLRRVVMNCLLENRRMQHIARKYEAELRFDHGDVVGEVMRGPNLFSLWREEVEDGMGFALAVLDLGRKRVKPAA